MSYIRKKNRDIWDYYLMYEELLEEGDVKLSFYEYYERMKSVDSVNQITYGTSSSHKNEK